MELRSFTTFLAALEDGRLVDQLTQDLRHVVEDLSVFVSSYGGEPKGQIDLTLKLKLVKGVFEILPEVKVKMPKAPHDRTLLWATRDNHLTHENPKQRDLFPKVTNSEVN